MPVKREAPKQKRWHSSTSACMPRLDAGRPLPGLLVTRSMCVQFWQLTVCSVNDSAGCLSQPTQESVASSASVSFRWRGTFTHTRDLKRDRTTNVSLLARFTSRSAGSPMHFLSLEAFMFIFLSNNYVPFYGDKFAQHRAINVWT